MAYSPNDWQTECENFGQRGEVLLKHNYWADCTFVVGDASERIYAHKLLLAIASPIFELMFFSNTENKDIEPIIRVPDIEPDVFRMMLRYAYRCEVSIDSLKFARSLTYTAEKYMLPQLKSICYEYFEAALCPNNVFEIYEFAKIHNFNLKKKCIELFCRKTLEILSEKSIINMQLETLVDLIENPKLNIDSELDLFRVAEMYFADKSPNKSDIHKVIRNIRFLTLTPEQFCKGPALSPLLEKSEQLTILSKLVLRNINLPMPGGFTNVRIDRNPLLYCKRIFTDETDWHLFNTNVQSFTFKVDTNIVLLGIQIPTQKGPIGDTYSEHVEASVGLASSIFSKLTQCKLIHDTSFNGIQTLMFEKNCRLKKYEEYEVYYHLKKCGTYPIGIGSDTLGVEEVNFIFSTPQRKGDCMTRSIIFKLDIS